MIWTFACEGAYHPQFLGTTNQHYNPCTASWHYKSASQSLHSFLAQQLSVTVRAQFLAWHNKSTLQSLHSMDPSSDLAQNLSYNVSPVHITKAAAPTME
jgi:hypothetical protein